ncbi:helix-turn-helix domain-containing protein [Ktedonobacter racemifer]|uniref:Transcriptional regulator, XRE family n=1 Tax=Ktedonobacter racemifer DSM 44963 TaxID=485913 RepID=D6TQ50_KTERA|nr:helix-turn-helix domain-containing protein [Ktedonobacter racemifer]EFH85698.1 transcriptional regulator, XRE family [Ktedonobacter racemifer DSM 44963]
MATQGLQPISERCCRKCGVRLNRYNLSDFCWPCQDSGRSVDSSTSPLLPVLAPSRQGTFTLRSILDSVQKTQPVNLSDVGQVLKHYRSIHHLTQRDLATILGFDQSYISKLENGQGLRDIAVLSRIAHCLAIPEQWLGIAPNGSLSFSGSELVEIAPSVIRLSQTVRETGRADAAVHELWPLTLRLEAQAEQDKSNVRLLLTLASAQAMLGILLGDLLPEEELWVSVEFFKKAAAIVDEFGDAPIQAEIYRGYGNELRKYKQYEKALACLEKALFLAPDNIAQGSVAALLARTYGEMGERENFGEVMRTVLYVQNRATNFTSTFNPVMIHEIHIRGLLSLGQISEHSRLLEQNQSQLTSIPVAPQWYVISQLTTAQAMFHLGKVDDGLARLQAALMGAELYKLPHQVQRAMRALKTVDAHQPAQKLGEEARLLLDRLSVHGP